MPNIQVIDKNKFGSFDGFILEISGLNGSAASKRIAINTLDQINIAKANNETMLILKTSKGGFGLIISEDKKTEWETLVSQVKLAKEHFKE